MEKFTCDADPAHLANHCSCPRTWQHSPEKYPDLHWVFLEAGPESWLHRTADVLCICVWPLSSLHPGRRSSDETALRRCGGSFPSSQRLVASSGFHWLPFPLKTKQKKIFRILLLSIKQIPHHLFSTRRCFLFGHWSHRSWRRPWWVWHKLYPGPLAALRYGISFQPAQQTPRNLLQKAGYQLCFS